MRAPSQRGYRRNSSRVDEGKGLKSSLAIKMQGASGGGGGRIAYFVTPNLSKLRLKEGRERRANKINGMENKKQRKLPRKVMDGPDCVLKGPSERGTL